MKILFFDGYCALCNNLVDWVMTQDKNTRIQFASLQGGTAKKIIPGYKLEESDTVVYRRDHQVLERSDAILYLLSDMGGFWKLAAIFFVIPKFIRDYIYRWLAANRYRFFKRRESCRMPTESEKNRLLP